MQAIVTGGSSGLGLAIAKRLAKQGYDLVLVAKDAGRLENAAEAVKKLNASVDVKTLATDLSVQGAPERVFEWAKEQGVQAEVLVNDAGTYIYDNVIDVSSERSRAILGLNVEATADMCRLFGADMALRATRKKPCYILNIASYSVYMPVEKLGYYAASKAFIKVFTTCFAKEMAHRNVLVTAVAPAGIDTDLMGLRTNIRNLARKTGFLAKPDVIARISLRVMKMRCIRYWIPLWYNAIAIPFLWMFQPLFKKVL